MDPDITGGIVPRERLRAVRHGRQRLGVDRRLVPRERTVTEGDGACCSPAGRGGSLEGSLDPLMADIPIPRKVVKGGSHLCTPQYCFRYRPAARQPEMIDTGMSHIGFRTIHRD